MKQRLGIAAALLKDPELVILDEPTNGTDPAGMAEMREFVRALGRGRRTVLLSSHLMGEVEQICDRVGVISGGRLIREGAVDDLRGRESLWVRVDPLELAEGVIRALRGVDRVARLDGGLRIEVRTSRIAVRSRIVSPTSRRSSAMALSSVSAARK